MQLYGILNKQAIETSRLSAKEAQASTERMEMINSSMHDIAKKTQQETVSMRIITLVTLFFLPGTFISVSNGQQYNGKFTLTVCPYQTIMSTDILKFQDNVKLFQQGALYMYLAITLPIMALTFGAWYSLHLWSSWKDEREAKREADPRRSSNIV